MTTRAHWGARSKGIVSSLWRRDGASQIVEFALSLPLLVLLVVGIFDFSTAISLKQKLNNAVREAARVAAADPANDLGSAGVPASVSDAFWVVENYLQSEKLNDCGLTAFQPIKTTGLTYVSTATGGTPACVGTANLVLTINRGCVTPVALSGTTIVAAYTCVQIQYPYTWQFGSVSGLVGGRFLGPTSLTTSASAYNEN
jgi:Flp pilus assembly protein TadG